MKAIIDPEQYTLQNQSVGVFDACHVSEWLTLKYCSYMFSSRRNTMVLPKFTHAAATEPGFHYDVYVLIMSQGH